ncbi:hypothetical protein C0Q70_13455 [Pomacea canaliculata]|uniref:Carbohydrate-binding domain-containing protein n=1 Tax=Pomacea canaliculata TaxID=400727 RepID=A0A2T7NXA6_POMCA|nr:hypothetical protein C0Q70_13455 [Pomacea canaliculata]
MTYSGRCVVVAVFIVLLIGVGVGIAIGYFVIPDKKDKGSSASTPATIVTKWVIRDIVVELEGVSGMRDPRTFKDIRGVNFPAPREATHVKVIWDDTTIYVGARMQEEHVWATYRQKDTRIYQENAFEVFFDVDNSMSWYKEIEINALETTWDLQLSRAYIDGGDWMDWEGIAEKGVFTDGGVNNISNPSTYWSMEMAFPISRLVENTTRSNTSPKDGEYWFAIFARPEYQTRENTTTGQYEVVPGSETSWWSWNPTGATNLHLPNRWGLLYFSSKPAGSADFSDREVTFRNWSMYQGLFQLFEDVWTFKKLNNMFPDDQRLYKVPPFISDCFASYTVNVTEDGNGFTATLTALDNPLFKGSIDQNRKVTFTGA